MASKLGTPKQIAVKIKKLKNEITLLSRAKVAETKAGTALKKAKSSMKVARKKPVKRKPARKKAARKPARKKGR